jgi:putative transposase
MAKANIIYHVMNRANAKVKIFSTKRDYDFFCDVLGDALNKYAIELLAFCIMPNHWHLILRPLKDKELSLFMAWLTTSHVQHWHFVHGTTGSGHLYKDRFKAIPVQSDRYFLHVLRYVERNPLRAKLVGRAEDWKWSSLWFRINGSIQEKHLLSPLPIEEIPNYMDFINVPQSAVELEEIRRSIKKSTPYGQNDQISWKKETASNLGLAVS